VASLGVFNEFTIWETASGQPLRHVQDEAIGLGNSLAFSPDGQMLATAGVTRVIFWDANSGEKLFILAGESTGATIGYNIGVGKICFSPDGRRLAVANMDGVSKVWDLATQAEVLALPPVGLPAKAIAYSPDGRFLATGGDEGILTLWDALRWHGRLHAHPGRHHPQPRLQPGRAAGSRRQRRRQRQNLGCRHRTGAGQPAAPDGDVRSGFSGRRPFSHRRTGWRHPRLGRR
jgi:hypothetical protein